MSSSALQQVIRRAVSDASFRQQLQANPASALRGFDLTADESAALSSRDPGRLAAFGVDQRISKAFSLGGAGIGSDATTDVPNSTGGVTRLEMEPGDATRLAVHDSGSAGSGATNAFDSGNAASGATNSLDSGIVGSGATNTLDSGTAGSGATNTLDSGTALSGATNTLDSGSAGSGATDVLDSGNAASGAAPAWHDDPQPVAATSDSSAPAWRDDAQPLAASSDASGSASAVHDVAPSDLSLGAEDDAPLGSLSAVHDVAPVDLSSDSIAATGGHDGLESISVDGDVDSGAFDHSQILHPNEPQ